MTNQEMIAGAGRACEEACSCRDLAASVMDYTSVGYFTEEAEGYSAIAFNLAKSIPTADVFGCERAA